MGRLPDQAPFSLHAAPKHRRCPSVASRIGPARACLRERARHRAPRLPGVGREKAASVPPK
eukprot:1821204-Pyramimonas_sp.AAC.1